MRTFDAVCRTPDGRNRAVAGSRGMEDGLPEIRPGQSDLSGLCVLPDLSARSGLSDLPELFVLPGPADRGRSRAEGRIIGREADVCLGACGVFPCRAWGSAGRPSLFRRAVPPGVRTVRFVNGRSFGALRESSFRRRLSGGCAGVCVSAPTGPSTSAARTCISASAGRTARRADGSFSASAGRVARYACCPVPLRRDVQTARVRAFLLPIPFSRRPPAPEADGIASFFGSSAPPWAFRPGKHRIKFVFTSDFSYLCGN